MTRHGLVSFSIAPDARRATALALPGNEIGGRAFRDPADPDTKPDTRITDAPFAEGGRGRDASLREMIEVACDEAPRLPPLLRSAKAATPNDVSGCKSCAVQSDCKLPYGA
jgi:hypothetical protein